MREDGGPLSVDDDIDAYTDALTSTSNPPGASDPGTAQVPGLRRALKVTSAHTRTLAGIEEVLRSLDARLESLERRLGRTRVGPVEVPNAVLYACGAVILVALGIGRARDLAEIIRAVVPG